MQFFVFLFLRTVWYIEARCLGYDHTLAKYFVPSRDINTEWGFQYLPKLPVRDWMKKVGLWRLYSGAIPIHKEKAAESHGYISPPRAFEREVARFLQKNRILPTLVKVFISASEDAPEAGGAGNYLIGISTFGRKEHEQAVRESSVRRLSRTLLVRRIQHEIFYAVDRVRWWWRDRTEALFVKKYTVPQKQLFILWENGTLPGLPHWKWLRYHSNTRVSTVFITEDDLTNEKVVREKVASFLSRYAINPKKVLVFVMIAKDPTNNWGKGFPYQMRVSVFPANCADYADAWKLETEQAA